MIILLFHFILKTGAFLEVARLPDQQSRLDAGPWNSQEVSYIPLHRSLRILPNPPFILQSHAILVNKLAIILLLNQERNTDLFQLPLLLWGRDWWPLFGCGMTLRWRKIEPTKNVSSVCSIDFIMVCSGCSVQKVSYWIWVSKFTTLKGDIRYT